MLRCLNCGYVLVLLERRRRYKCSKCGKIFSLKQAESKEFREYNKRQKQADKESWELQRKLRRKTLKPSKMVNPAEKQRKIQEYYKANRERILERQRERYWKNHAFELERCSEWRENHKIWRTQYNRQWEQNNLEKRKEWLKNYLLTNKKQDKLKNRLRYWRSQQVKIAVSKPQTTIFEANCSLNHLPNYCICWSCPQKTNH